MNFSHVSDFYVDDPGDKLSSEDEPQPKRRRVYKRQWKLKGTFGSEEAAEKALEDLQIWKRCSVKKRSAGDAVYYRCSKGKYRDYECTAGMFLLYHCASD